MRAVRDRECRRWKAQLSSKRGLSQVTIRAGLQFEQSPSLRVPRVRRRGLQLWNSWAYLPSGFQFPQLGREGRQTKGTGLEDNKASRRRARAERYTRLRIMSIEMIDIMKVFIPPGSHPGRAITGLGANACG